MLCPVRQLHLYINDTKHVRRGCTRMFLLRNQNIRNIVQSDISKWIIEVVKTAYLSTNQELPEKITAHELRALAALWGYTSHIALEDVLSATFWRSSGVFQRCYLRDLASIADEMSSLVMKNIAALLRYLTHLWWEDAMAYVFDDHRAIFAGFTLGPSISRLRTTTWNSKLSYDSKLLYNISQSSN